MALDARTDKHDFPLSLPFDSPTDIVTREIPLTAAEVERDDVLLRGEGQSDVVVMRKIDLTPVGGKVLLHVREAVGSFPIAYAPTDPVVVRRTKNYTAKMPDQRSVTDQLTDLIPIADEAGFTLASALLTDVVNRIDSALPTSADLIAELRALRKAARRSGMYDADDFLQRITTPSA